MQNLIFFFSEFSGSGLKSSFESGSGAEVPEHFNGTSGTSVHESSATDEVPATRFVPTSESLQTEDFDYYDFLSTAEPPGSPTTDVTTGNDVTTELDSTTEYDDTSFYDETATPYDGTAESYVTESYNATSAGYENTTSYDVIDVHSHDVTATRSASKDFTPGTARTFSGKVSGNATETNELVCQNRRPENNSVYLVKLGFRF